MTAPIVLLVGFLGSGKTTFIREILPLLAKRQLAPFVIINDYQNARIDASRLRDLTADVEAINGNCVCCDSLNELIDTLLAIPEVPNRVVLIETNGTTDPFALIEHLVVIPEMKARFAPLLQVSVIDVKRWGKRHWNNDLEILQMQPASHLYFSHRDEVDTEQNERVRGHAVFINARAEVTGLAVFAEVLTQIVTQQKTVNAVSLPGHDHEQVHKHDHGLSHGFVACQFPLPAMVSGERLVEWLRHLPVSVLRVKGLVQMTEFPGQDYVFQRTDDGEATITELPIPPNYPPCVVLVGVNLDVATLHQTAAATLSLA